MASVPPLLFLMVPEVLLQRLNDDLLLGPAQGLVCTTRWRS